MPVSMSGMASGMDTDAIVDKLVNVEARPIKQLEIRKKNHNARKDALKSLSRLLNDVNSAAKDLYGFRTSFNDKNAVSSDNSVIEAKASMQADKGVRKIKVNQIATSHKVSTDPVPEKETLPAGKFTIEVDGSKQTITFKGGTLKNLGDKLDEAASDLVSTSYIRKDGDTYILTIQSKKTGEKGEIKLSGDRELLDKIGLTGGQAGAQKNEIAVSFDSRYFTSYMGEKRPEAENGSVSVKDGGRSVSVRGALWREYALPVEMAVKGDTTLEFDLSYRDQESGDDGSVPKRLRVGPKEKVNIKGIILESYNVERKREGKKEDLKGLDSLMGIGIVANENGKRVEKVYSLGRDLKGPQTIAAGRDLKGGKINKIILYCNRGTMELSGLRLATPADRKPGYAMKNVIAPAQDAKITVDGIEITRDRNDGLTDVIKGVTLTVKRPSQHEVDLNVEHSIDTSVDKIKKFVDAYNKYLDMHRDLTKAVMSQKPGDYDKNFSQQGLFMGDMTLMRLQGTLQVAVTSAYPNSADKPIRMFAEMGVSTGSINAEWESIKSGKLVVDEALLKKTILENPEGVTQFFGSDADGDNKADNGMAFRVVAMLKPYVSPGKNIIAAKIDMEDSGIKMADESIKAKEDHLKKYEEKLKRKFAAMEQAISQTNAQRQWMKNQMGGGSDDKEK
ncbi:MAG TPA: flagellar filament capping protein FliD [Spirochaetota bacterium]|nr:flagellar filament capping protein FliD [Spirochaetota bacterium]HPC41226.1 flagellar filament capping protein FliD [Spirochaetota bacterium]HQF08162.1 flagellar filament capping protein FliD [Spirochaetota bacterium]HQH96951.1 flagellar filament capping protein FliD [Spirochaetota bacterium]HQJ70133.1 flagellar filament capping protein FliD [Spirochaetota bacterium]